MGFFNKNNNSLERVSSKSFAQWATENKQSIEARLIDEAIAFLNAHGEDLRTPVSSLIIDNRWHYIDKPAKKQSYRASLDHNSDGIPYLALTYYTFRHGGHSERFDSKSVLKALWQEARGGLFSSPLKTTIKPRIEPVPEINPIDWIARDQESWQSMTDAGDSHYLQRKGLSEGIIPGIKHAKHHIAVAIIDTQNTFLGLQRIFNDGQKRFTKGLSKKGHFALIGCPSLPEKISTIHVCEGVATAASIHRAIGEPVFAALDAFNLLPVCKSLKRHYPKTQIIIWADNDWQKADIKTKFGRVLGNTGLIQANRTAFKLRGTLVCTPDFSTFDSELIKEATDFNDLHRLDGLNRLVSTIPQKPDIHLGLWHELRHFNQHAHGAVAPGQFRDGIKLSYNSRYLPNDVFKREGVHLVRSAIGTGKTAIVEHLVKQNPKQSVLFTTHLISLVESAASRLGLTSYNECDNFDLQIEHRLAICLNSLGKLTAEGSLRHYDVVIIDEIEQVLARLTSHIEQKPLIFSVLQHIMTNAKTLICLDAHLSQATVQMIQRFCPNHPVTIHFNRFEPGSARQIAFHDSPESVQMTAMQALEQEQKVYLAFNSKKEAFKTYSALNIAFPEKKGLYISSDNAGDAENQAFFNNVNEVSKRYDYLVCTPSVSTGVSIDNGHFDFVGGVFNAQVNTANDCMQALGRIRNHKTLHVFCDKRQAFKSLNPDVIASKWLNTHQYDISLMNLDKEGQRIILNPDYEQLTLLVTQVRHASFNDFYQQFALLALHDGMKLTYFDTTLDVTTQQQLRHFKNACIEQDASLISQEQLPLTAAQLVALAQKPRKTMSESRQYKKQQLIEFYNLSERDEASITAMANMDNDGRFKKQILALELALGDTALAQKRFVAQLEDGAQFAADLTHFSTLQLLYKKVLETLHLTTTHQTLALHDFQYTKDTILNSGFVTWIEEHRTILQGLISVPSAQLLQRDPLRFLSMLLGKMGLKQKRVGKAALGLYHLDVERINLLNALIMRRAKGLAGISAPLDTSHCHLKEPSTTEFFIETFKKIKRFFTLDNPDIPVFA
ncbi:plasmid replication protein, CyRepA1 family [Legionella pneumophila]|uniref:plasmid replication protein, CyRepA1 family n=1 Tax=Legionella pneumophila TaxID=446 RepID=UPI00077082D8|nr:plasmid replication protein, CyRepA1 family [Legionella pneumophila]CZP46096.1 DNA primase TraC [Legionella pneumophila]